MSGAGRIRSSVAYYQADADDLVGRYRSVSFEDVYPQLLKELPRPGANVLDVGAGSGRDALALARMGYNVTGVEPVSAFRRHARLADQLRQVRWLDDRLPKLNKIKAEKNQYAFILCSAVLMHIKPVDIGRSFDSLKELLIADGTLAVSIRDRKSDDPERLVWSYSNELLIEAGERAGLHHVQKFQSSDTLGRSALKWRTLLFRKR